MQKLHIGAIRTWTCASTYYIGAKSQGGLSSSGKAPPELFLPGLLSGNARSANAVCFAAYLPLNAVPCVKPRVIKICLLPAWGGTLLHFVLECAAVSNVCFILGCFRQTMEWHKVLFCCFLKETCSKLCKNKLKKKNRGQSNLEFYVLSNSIPLLLCFGLVVLLFFLLQLFID